MTMGADFGSARVGLGVFSLETDVKGIWFVTTSASSPISTSTGFALMTFFLMIFTTFSPSGCCSPSVDRSDDDFVTVLRMIFLTILFTLTGGGGGEVANEEFSSFAGCDVGFFPFSTIPFVTVGWLIVVSGCVSVFDSITTEAAAMGPPFVIGLGLSIGFALLIAVD